jgi:hypothetical protein
MEDLIQQPGMEDLVRRQGLEDLELVGLRWVAELELGGTPVDRRPQAGRSNRRRSSNREEHPAAGSGGARAVDGLRPRF